MVYGVGGVGAACAGHQAERSHPAVFHYSDGASVPWTPLIECREEEARVFHASRWGMYYHCMGIFGA